MVQAYGSGQIIAPGQTIALAGLRVTGVAAYNIIKTNHPKSKNWLGFIVEIGTKRIYLAGDTELTPEMMALSGIDVAFLPVDGLYTMDAAEAAEAATGIDPALAIPYHWGDIAGTRSDAETFADLAACDVKVLTVGESICMGGGASIPRPVAHWKLNESTGTIAHDAAGSHDGTLRGNPLWLPGGGKIDGALRLDGTGDYVEVADHPDFDLTGQISVTAWILAEALDRDWQTVVTKGDYGWKLRRFGNSNSIEFQCYNPIVGSPESWNVVGGAPINDRQWHHVAGTYDGTTICIYVDGVLGASDSAHGPLATNKYSIRIGDNSQTQGRYWHGMVDDVRIYDEALSESQIKAVMTGLEAWIPTESRDIGTPVIGGDAYAGGVYTIVADGADIWNYRDEFRYVYTAVTGDFEFSAHVLSLENTNLWVKAGVMVRETLDAEARHAFMCVTPEDGEGRFAFQCRPATPGLSTSLHSIQGQASFPTNTWVKIKRQGDSFTALTSQDGIVWTKFTGPEVDSQGYPSAPNPVTIDMPETVYIGLALTSHSNGQLCTAQFDNVQIDNPAATP